MKNNRTLFPPLFGEIPSGGGGGGSGNKIQLAELPEASLEYKDRIVQYIGATTGTLTNGYFYKCVEHTTTEGETITVTYSWDNAEVQKSGSKIVKTVVADGVKTYGDILNELMTNTTINVAKKYSLTELNNAGKSEYINTAVLSNELYFFRTFYYNGIVLMQINAKPTNSTMYMNSTSYINEKPANETIFTLYESED